MERSLIFDLLFQRFNNWSYECVSKCTNVCVCFIFFPSINCVNLKDKDEEEVQTLEIVLCLKKIRWTLKDIWEEIEIFEDQRLQQTDGVHMHIKKLLDMIIIKAEHFIW